MVEKEISNLVTEIVNELKPYIGVTFKGEDLYDYNERFKNAHVL